MSEERERAGLIDRRRFLEAALAGALAGAGQGVASGAPAPKRRPKKACILLWMEGGPSQLDTVDPKPGAPAGIRGEFRATATNVGGIQLCEHLPRLARQADKLAIIRSMATADASHLGATYHLATGYPRRPGMLHPEVGAVAGKYLHAAKAELPGFVSLGSAGLRRGYPGEGFLGPAYQPLRLRSWSSPPPGKLRALCDVTTEWGRYRPVYGESTLGRNCLAARRLVEAGVSFVAVHQGGYDTHTNNFAVLRSRLGELDPAWSGLLQDLHERHLLKTTLVVWLGEFGRSPRINAAGGRDHWTRGWSVVLAGGGVKGGLVHGATDASGLVVTNDPVTEAELLATVYAALGIDPRATNACGAEAIPLVPPGAAPLRGLLG
jgi:hypothetical protein